jgi:quercetin dioxygenase-like cupin family protein
MSFSPDYDQLDAFAFWWLQTRSINTPTKSALIHQKDTHGVVLYRQGQFQVELFNVKPNSVIIPHIHPNVDSYEVFVGGDIIFSCDGVEYAQTTLGDRIRVKPSSWHGGHFGPSGGVFLSIQHWLNGVEPGFVGDDWVAADGSPNYNSSDVVKELV